MIKKLIRKMLTAAGGPFRIQFTPEQIALFERQATRVPGMNNSGMSTYRTQGVLAQQYQELEAKRKELERLSRLERPRVRKPQTASEILAGKEPEYETRSQVIGMSGADPLLSFYVAGVGLNGIGALAKTGLWNVAKYAPTTQLGNWGRGYFVGNTFKNSFNGTVPTLASQTTSLLYQPAKLNESGLTSLKFFERPSKIDLATKLGLTKHEKTNLNRFLKEALEDLELYVNSGLYRLFPTINIETAEPFWGKYGNPPAIRLLIEEGVHSIRGRGKEWLWNRPNGGTYELVTDVNGNFGIGYNSYKLFDISPEFNVRVGEASAGSGKNGYSKIFLTAPKNDAIYFITETPELELAKKTLIETQSPRINKNIMRDFWSGVLQSLRPGVYLSGDEGMLPKGATLIRLFKELSKKGYKQDNNGNIIGSGRTTWEDIRNQLMRPEKWKRREDGLSTDSYLALLKLANRENSPYYLRYSPDGFTTFNSQSIDNKFISDLLEKTKTGEATLLEFLEAFHNWVNPYGGIDAKVVNGEIIIPHPFLYKKKQGGKINKFQKGTINGGILPDVKVTPTKLYLETYYPGISKYPATGHSALYGYRTYPKGYWYYNFDSDEEPESARIDKKSSDAGYNFVTNNCADATRCALEAISGKKMNPNFFTTPGDVLDFFKENFDVRKSTRGGIGESLYYTNITPALLEIISKLLKALIEANRQKRQKERLLAKNLKGGKMNILEFLKNGSGIHIKEKNKGSFTRWCGGNVTEECIRRGKASSNPKIRKKATFADNARHFKHLDGGVIKAASGFNFKKIGDFINNNGSTLGSLISNGVSLFGNASLRDEEIENANLERQLKSNNFNASPAERLQYIKDNYISKLSPEENYSPIVGNYIGELLNKAYLVIAKNNANWDYQLKLNDINLRYTENTNNILGDLGKNLYSFGKSFIKSKNGSPSEQNLATSQV